MIKFEEESKRDYDCIGDENFRLNILLPSFKPQSLNNDSCNKTNEMLLLTYLLTPRCRVLLKKLTGLQLVNKFPAFHGTRRFITALTSVRHLSLSWASPIQSIYSQFYKHTAILNYKDTVIFNYLSVL